MAKWCFVWKYAQKCWSLGEYPFRSSHGLQVSAPLTTSLVLLSILMQCSQVPKGGKGLARGRRMHPFAPSPKWSSAFFFFLAVHVDFQQLLSQLWLRCFTFIKVKNPTHDLNVNFSPCMCSHSSFYCWRSDWHMHVICTYVVISGDDLANY